MILKKSVLIVTGTPGTGKTLVSSILGNMLGYKHIDLTKLAIERKALYAYDYVRKTYIIDEEALRKILDEKINKEKEVIIDTHYPCIVEKADAVVILKTETEELKKRLEKRGWESIKITENIENELMNSILNEARKCHPDARMVIVDTTDRNPTEVAEEIIEKLDLS